jgi:hypothetical protein
MHHGPFAPITATVALWLLPMCAGAQWLDLPTPGIPRTADGKPNLTAPAPRSADGKPDLSGLWRPDANPYSDDLIQDAAEEAIFKPEAEAIFRKRATDFGKDAPHTHCLPEGPHQIFGTGGPDHSLYRIMQLPNVVGLLYEGGGFRQFYLDGRTLPKDPNPTWYGYSVGRWEGDTLVVDTAGFNDRSWLDESGHPHSEELHITERFQRVDFGHIKFQIMFDDPRTLTRPLTRSLTLNYAADTDMLEYICNEGERDAVHYMGKANNVATIGRDTLSKYSAVYERRGDDGRVQMSATVSVVNGDLFFQGLPLVPRSQTQFDSAGGAVEFVTNAAGAVTHLVLHAVEGAERFDRKR